MSMKIIKDILDRKSDYSRTVNSNKKNITTVDSLTVNSITVIGKIEALLDDEKITPEGVGKMLCEGLDDLKSERYYTILASENSQGKLFEALSITKDAYRRGVIRTTKAIYFQAILRRWKLKTKFKKTE